MSGPEIISTKQKAFLISQGIFQWLVAVFVTSTVWLMAYNRNWQILHTWHVFLSTIGFSFLMAEAVALLNPGNIFVLGCGKLIRGYLHGFLMFCATVAIIAGVSIKIHEKNNNNLPHFTSIHGITGFTAYLLTICTFLGGIVVLFTRELYKKFGIKAVIIKKIHIFLGIAAYVIGSVSLGYGLHNYFVEALNSTRLGLIVILGIYVAISLIGPVITLFRF